MKISDLITYLSTSIVPIVGLIISVITLRNDSKKKDIQNQIDIGSNNSISQTNITISPTIKSLQKQEQKLSDFQQNIETLRKFFITLSPLLLVIILLTNLYDVFFPLQKMAWSSDTFTSNITYIFQHIYTAVFLSINNFLILIVLVSVALAIKIIITGKGTKSILLAISYGVLAVIYYISFVKISSMKASNFTLPTSVGIDLTLNNAASRLTPFVVVLCLMFTWVVASTIMLKMFETKSTAPNLKLLKVSLPRFGFYIFSILLPFIIMFITEYAQH